MAASASFAKPLVAIIDSGVARTPELRSVLVGEIDAAAKPARTPFQPVYDHGTMVATILNREAKGQVDIISIRIDDPSGCPRDVNPPCQRSSEPIIRAIDKAVSLGVSAINISLSLKDDPWIAEAIGAATRRGVLVVMAAGNEGRDGPGNLRMATAGGARAVLVGALDAAGNPWAGTNRPHPVNQQRYQYAWQLGVNVPTTAATGRAVNATGTSFAVPIETARRMIKAPVERSAGRRSNSAILLASLPTD
jgi:subtilisin family serine protease